MGRPQISGDSIVVAIDTELLVWTDGHLSGDKTLVSTSKLASFVGLEVQLFVGGPTYVADLNDKADLMNVVAALFAAGPGRAKLLEAPAVVMGAFELPFEDVMTPVDEQGNPIEYDDEGDLANAGDYVKNLREEGRK